MRPRHAQDKHRKARHEERAETASKRGKSGKSGRDDRGKSGRDDRGAGRRDERGAGKRDDRGTGKRGERGAGKRGAGKRDDRVKSGTRSGRRDERGAGKRDERSADRDERGAGKREVRAKSGGAPRPARRDARSAGRRDERPRTSDPRPARRDERGAGRLGQRKVSRDERPAARREPRPGERRPARPQPQERPVQLVERPVLAPPRGGIQPGDWLLTTREGAEQDVIDELALAGVVAPPAHVLAPALVVAPRWPKREKQLVPVTFARQALPVQVSVRNTDWEALVARLGRLLTEKLAGAAHYALHVWVPDSTEANQLASSAEQLEARLSELLASQLPDAKRMDDAALRRLGSMPFAQVCLAEQGHAIAGVMYSNQAISLARGGRTRVRVSGELPSRAARKVEEALAWLGVAPGPGEVCVDLGAAPGGWTYVLSERRARVIAVDPAKLRPEIAARKNVEHVPHNAFQYEPPERVDWLFCDMAYRPLEVAALLARWGRRGWARMLVANVKLPMKKKAEILARVRHILEHEGEWKHVKTRQLYHDRDEITLTALRA